MRVSGLIMWCGVFGAAIGVGTLGGVAAAAPVTTPTSTSVSVSPGTVHPHESVTVTATVTTPAGVIPTGTVDVTRGAQTLCSDVAVDPVTGTASCVTGDPLTLGNATVRATFTTAAGAGFGPSSGRAPLAAARWAPVLVATAVANSAGCPQGQALRFEVKAPAAAAKVTGLPAPTGTVAGPPASAFSATLTGGVATLCAPVYARSLTYTYSGDANYDAARASLAIVTPNHTPRGGSGGPTPAPSTAAPTLAATGPDAGAVPALTLGLGLLLVGGGFLAGARARRRT